MRNPMFQLANLRYSYFTELTDLEQLKVIIQSENLLKTASFFSIGCITGGLKC